MSLRLGERILRGTKVNGKRVNPYILGSGYIIRKLGGQALWLRAGSSRGNERKCTPYTQQVLHRCRLHSLLVR